MEKEKEREAEKGPYDGTELPKDLKELKAHFGGRLDRYSRELKDFAEERFHQFLIVTPGTHKRKGYCTFCRRNLDLGNLPGLPDMPRNLKHNDTTICPRCGHELTVITHKRYEEQEVFFYWWEKSAINPLAIVCRGIHGLRRRERDSMEKARTVWETDSASVFIYGKGSIMAYSKKDQWMEKEMRYSLKYVLGKVHGRTGQYTGGLGWWTVTKKVCLWAEDSFRRAREGTPFAWIEGFGKHITECQAVGTPIWDLADGELFSMAMFCKYRSWEWLMKMGLSDILEDYATRRDPSVWDIFNFRGKTVDKIFKGHLTKEDKKFLYYEKLDNTGPIKAWQAWRKRWPSITLKEVALLDDFTGNEMRHGYLSGRLQDMMLVIRPDRLLRYAMKEEDRNEKICLRDYLDYYEECRDLGKNLSDKDVIFPADFKKAHEHASKELVALKNFEKQGKWDKRRPACEERYRFEDKSGRYLVVVPEKLQDLVTEGEHMHNCVGTYTDQLADGGSDILFVRKAENPAESYITVEVDPHDGHIRQAREKYNRDIEDTAAKDFIRTLEKHAMKEAARAKVIEIRNPEQRGEQCEERRMAQ